MDQREFLLHRVAFAGLPYGELRAAAQRLDAGLGWRDAFLTSARGLCRLALRAERVRGWTSAAQAWLQAACAFHAASFGPLLDLQEARWREHILRLRRRARRSYRRALAVKPELGEPCSIETPLGPLSGYLRVPPGRAAPLVVLFNGLDSIAEVELHAFGEAFLARGLAVLALDLPADLFAPARRPLCEVERVAPALADWAVASPRLRGKRVGAFGVSMGGQLAARALCGDARFAAAVAISPNAAFVPAFATVERMRRMIALAFDLESPDAVKSVAPRMELPARRPDSGALWLAHMEQDGLFGAEQAEAYARWGGGGVTVRRWRAEHVGTSRVHDWLPQAADWLERHLTLDGGTHAS